jgi:hypothetical protein
MHHTSSPQSDRRRKVVMRHLRGIFFAVAVCFMVLALTPVPGSAFDTVKWGDGQEFTVYGFLRNNLGYFTEARIPGSENGNEFAACRTVLRTYLENRFSDKFRVWVTLNFSHEPWYEVEDGTESSRTVYTQDVLEGGKEYSEYDNINDVVKEAYFEFKPNFNNTFKVGRQIAIWGEGIVGSPNDVVQPSDGRFGFVSTSIEESRIPQWMIRGLQSAPSISTTFDWIVGYNLVGQNYSVNRTAKTGQRFGIYPPTSLPPPVGDGWWPGLPATMTTDYPEHSVDDLRYGLRIINGAFKNIQFGGIYFHYQNYSPIFNWNSASPSLLIPTPGGVVFVPPLADVTQMYPEIDVVGMFMNKQLTMVPGVLKAEAAWTPNQPFNYFVTQPQVAGGDRGWTRRDQVKYLIGWDITNYFYYSWHKDAAFDLRLEHTGTWVPNASDLVSIIIYNEKLPSYSAGFSAMLSTSWLYNRFTTQILGTFNTFGNSGLLVPSVGYNAPWYNNMFTFTLQYTKFYSDSYEQGIGLFRSRDLLQFTSQMNF